MTDNGEMPPITNPPISEVFQQYGLPVFDDLMTDLDPAVEASLSEMAVKQSARPDERFDINEISIASMEVDSTLSAGMIAEAVEDSARWNIRSIFRARKELQGAIASGNTEDIEDVRGILKNNFRLARVAAEAVHEFRTTHSTEGLSACIDALIADEEEQSKQPDFEFMQDFYEERIQNLRAVKKQLQAFQ